MSLLPPSTDYTDKDFDALRSRLMVLVQSVFPEWSDFSVASFGNVLLEMYAFVGDVLTFYQDNLARESRLITATERKNVIALARMLGYRLHGAEAAQADILLTLSRPPIANVVIPAGTIVRTQEVTEPVRFQLLHEVVFPAGDASGQVATAECSTTRTTLVDALGLANLDVPLDYTPYLDGSATVSTPSGAYVEVESLLSSGPNDRHFMVLVDQNDRATLRFGNGASGAAPTGTLTITYKTGGGKGGNVDAERLVVIEGAFTDIHGRPVQVSVTNPEPASGGADRQSVASAKILAPESLRTLTRTVTREDFEVNAKRVPGVARALMLTSNEDLSIDENTGILFVVPDDGTLATPGLKNAVLHQVTEVYPHTLTFQVFVQSPVWRNIDVEARVYLRQGVPAGTVRERIRQNLEAFFALQQVDGTPNPTVDFGFNIKDAFGNPAGEIAWSDVFNTVRDTVGVRKVGDGAGDLKLNGHAADVKIGIKDFPRLGTVTLLNGDTGGIL